MLLSQGFLKLMLHVIPLNFTSAYALHVFFILTTELCFLHSWFFFSKLFYEKLAFLQACRFAAYCNLRFKFCILYSKERSFLSKNYNLFHFLITQWIFKENARQSWRFDLNFGERTADMRQQLIVTEDEKHLSKNEKDHSILNHFNNFTYQFHTCKK